MLSVGYEVQTDFDRKVFENAVLKGEAPSNKTLREVEHLVDPY